MKTKFSSCCLNGIAEGCRHCVKGRKLVLFISGKCSRKCWYCSLSEKRKDKDIIWANEREITNTDELINEVQESHADSAGITGGDPLLFIERTLKFAKTLKSKFGKEFHIHIYLPTKLVNSNNLRKLSKYIDEVRFHPEFILNREKIKEDVEKIRLANQFWKINNIGIELPMIPNKKSEILNFIKIVREEVGFINLNEFEISETNFQAVLKKYKLNRDTYTIKDSDKSGIWLLNQLKKQKVKNKVHFCTANLKNNYQYKNRLKLHKILPFGRKTSEGTVTYLAVYPKNLRKAVREIRSIGKCFPDTKNKRIILSEKTAEKIIKERLYKIARVEEHPTYDSTVMDFCIIN
ncbi:MAG: 4Fe-4S cluster-binding domain-containing protein [Nanoarchaeota archaeon]|nr:4Fe-4S cluster-binding domain-containing protein [Nanoarchaeota archaeon]MBU4086515.1 4Fe-4S cluster-binding domain-containing protein [Nanoarchaeota archaeon]